MSRISSSPTRSGKICKHTSPGQAADPPILEDLPKQQPPDDERKVLGEAGYAATATRVDIAVAIARLARFVERWGVWAPPEILHLLGYLAATWEYELHFLYNKADSWEQLFLGTHSDTHFRLPQSMAGCVAPLEGVNGTFLPIGWKAGLLGFPATSSSDPETGGLGRALKRTMLLARSSSERGRASCECFGRRVTRRSGRLLPEDTRRSWPL